MSVLCHVEFLTISLGIILILLVCNLPIQFIVLSTWLWLLCYIYLLLYLHHKRMEGKEQYLGEKKKSEIQRKH